MPLFDDARFPTAISRRATGGPERRTEVVTTASGREERNSRWAHSRRKYNIGFGLKSVTDLQAVIAFFEARRGRLYAFRYKDFTDFKSCAPTANISATDQMIGTGTGVTSTFQLVKHYGAPLRDYQRSIFAPVSGTVLVAVNGTPSVNFITDTNTGLITFNPGSIPATGATITAGFEFDVPVRFDTDQITVNLAHFNAGEVPDIPLIEVRP
jgi:uncharacterized protein (TIGR02217 family)